MKLKRIDGPVRTIELGYEEEKPLSDYETQIINRYVEIHNTHAGYESSAEEYAVRIIATDKLTNNCRSNLASIKQQLNTLLAHAGEANKGGIRAVRLQGETEAYNRDVQTFHEGLCAANEAWCTLCEEFNDYYDGWEIRFEDELSEFSDFTDQLYSNYENYMLDTNSFGDDHEQFRECLQKTNKKLDILYDDLQKGLASWEALATEANLFYDFVKIQDRFTNLKSKDMQN
jgi:enolase